MLTHAASGVHARSPHGMAQPPTEQREMRLESTPRRASLYGACFHATRRVRDPRVPAGREHKLVVPPGGNNGHAFTQLQMAQPMPGLKDNQCR